MRAMGCGLVSGNDTILDATQAGFESVNGKVDCEVPAKIVEEEMQVIQKRLANRTTRARTD